MVTKYDLIVVGAGPAGEKGAAQAAYYGKRVSLVDVGPRPGGIAVSTAGIPTKTVREGAIYLAGVGQSACLGTTTSPPDPWTLLMARKLEVSELMTVSRRAQPFASRHRPHSGPCPPALQPKGGGPEARGRAADARSRRGAPCLRIQAPSSGKSGYGRAPYPRLGEHPGDRTSAHRALGYGLGSRRL